MFCISASATIEAPRDLVYDTLTDVEDWPHVFPTIRAARVTRRDRFRIDVAVEHREGAVANVVTLAGPALVVLDERKRRYDATFLNRLTRLGDDRTCYEVLGCIRLRGWLRVLQPFLGRHARRQLLAFTVEPVKEAAEAVVRARRP
jgi:hypothetical protein